MMLSTFLLSSFLMAAEPCGVRLQAFSIWEDLEGNRIVEKHSVFPLGNWSDASAFEGVIVSRSEGPKMSLVIELKNSPNGRAIKTATFPFQAWERDAKSLVARGFNARQFLGNAGNGVYTMTVLKENEIVCRETHGIVSEGAYQ